MLEVGSKCYFQDMLLVKSQFLKHPVLHPWFENDRIFLFEVMGLILQYSFIEIYPTIHYRPLFSGHDLDRSMYLEDLCNYGYE